MRLFLTILLLSLSMTQLIALEIRPIPLAVSVDKEKANLGRKLFFDPILSKDETISCASCHNLQTGGDDNLQFSFGIHSQLGHMNSPTVFNSVFNFRQFWDGRAKDLQTQALGPIENPLEMGNTFTNLITTLKKSPYNKEFIRLYPKGITKNNITHAIAEYEKGLITPNAPFDKYLRGDKTAITKEAKAGYNLFKEKGCISCHHGINVGGNMYNKFGIIKNLKSSSLGRYNITKRERDKYYFKVPSLRNVENTAPYFHDGRHEKLEDTVKDMAYYQIGRPISKDEVAKIIAFLHSLTGELPKGIQP